MSDIQWLVGYGPKLMVPALINCSHVRTIAVAVGTDDKHFALMECRTCYARAWRNERGTITTHWLLPASDVSAV